MMPPNHFAPVGTLGAFPSGHATGDVRQGTNISASGNAEMAVRVQDSHQID